MGFLQAKLTFARLGRMYAVIGVIEGRDINRKIEIEMYK